MDQHDADGHRTKRFRHESHAQSLKKVHLPTASHRVIAEPAIEPIFSSSNENDDAESCVGGSQFRTALDGWSQLNLSPSFIQFSKAATPLCQSLPLLILNWHEVVDLWLDAISDTDEEGTKVLLDLLQKLTYDLRATLAPAYPRLLARLLLLLSKELPAEILTVLLSSFSALFKYLLLVAPFNPVAVDERNTLEFTWTFVHDTLVGSGNAKRACPVPEVQRAFAEVWGNVLRRLKSGDPRHRAVTLLARDIDGMDDAAAYMVAFACISVSQTLHTSTASILRTLLEYHLKSEHTAPTSKLLRRVITSFSHHVKNEEQFRAVADLLVDAVDGCGDDVRQLARALGILSVACCVRRGSRMKNHLDSIMDRVHKMLVDDPPFQDLSVLYPVLLRLVPALLVSGDLRLWASSGRQLLQGLWDKALPDNNSAPQARTGALRFVITLHAVLGSSDLAWGGWKSVGIPSIMRATSRLIGSPDGAISTKDAFVEGKRTLMRVLAALARESRLHADNLDVVCNSRLETYVTRNMERSRLTWKDTQPSSDLEDSLVLARFFSSSEKVTRELVQFLNVALGEDVVAVQPSTATTRVISLALKRLASRPVPSWCTSNQQIQTWLRTGVTYYTASHDILNGLCDMIDAVKG
ncbi:hypothetical protein FISHEDRAFT_52592 [Fistulina hepatica ATCC 64428]|nr:hypothetical protein FISHEDRAFT_52592 [Fistulina hepatica ATCC 64428]